MSKIAISGIHGMGVDCNLFLHHIIQCISIIGEYIVIPLPLLLKVKHSIILIFTVCRGVSGRESRWSVENDMSTLWKKNLLSMQETGKMSNILTSSYFL